jgi:hypothetical protein
MDLAKYKLDKENNLTAPGIKFHKAMRQKKFNHPSRQTAHRKSYVNMAVLYRANVLINSLLSLRRLLSR